MHSNTARRMRRHHNCSVPDGTESDTTEQRFAAAAGGLFATAYRAAYKILGDSGLSEDVAQEALVRALTRWEQVESYAAAWTTRVASNLAIDEWRRRRADLHDSLDSVQAGFSDQVDLRDELTRALARIPQRRREAIVLRLVCDLSPEDAALAMGTSVAGVLKHTVRGMADLRRLMRPPESARVPDGISAIGPFGVPTAITA